MGFENNNNNARTRIQVEGDSSYLADKVTLTAGTGFDLNTETDGFTFNKTDSESVADLRSENSIQDIEIVELQANAGLDPVDKGTLVSDTFSDINGFSDSVNDSLTTAHFDSVNAKYERESYSGLFEAANSDYLEVASGTYDNKSALSISMWVKLNNWFDSSWPYRAKVTVASSQVDANLTDFPVFVDLSDLPAHFFSNVKSAGEDIRVTASDGTQLAREVVSISTGGSTGELHFKADSLSSSSDTEFYIYYGNSGASEPAVSDTYGRNNVWTEYDAVYHHSEDPSGTAPQLIDSTGNGNDGTSAGSMTSGDLVGGKVGEAWDYDGNDDLVDISTFANGDNSFTISFWTNMDTVSGSNSEWIRWAESGKSIEFMYLDSSGQDDFYVQFFDSGGSGIVTPSPTPTLPSTGTWEHMVGRYDDSTGEWTYLLNSNVEETATAAVNPTVDGSLTTIGGRSDISRYVDGRIDEFRITKKALTDEWISTEYNNQNDPSSFYTVSSEVDSILMDMGSSSNKTQIQLVGSVPKSLTTTDNNTEVTGGETTNNLADAAWHHVVFVYNGSTSKLYFDGSEEASVAATGDIDAATVIRYGTLVDGTKPFDGNMQVIQVYDEELTSSDVSTLYNSGNGTYAPISGKNLIHYLPLNGDVKDASGNSVSTTNSNVSFVTASAVSDQEMDIVITLPTISGEVTHTYLFVNDPDRESDDSITYDLEDAAGATDTGLSISDSDTSNKNALSNVDGTNMSGGKLTINLEPATTPTEGNPSVKTYVLVLVKA